MLIVYCTVSVNFPFLFLVQLVSRLLVFFLLICENFLFIKESLHLSVIYCKHVLPICPIPSSYMLPPDVLHFYVIQLVNSPPPLCLKNVMFCLENISPKLYSL